ncbi:MAG: CAP domain-containing protein [Microcoleaceae cyanobacterium]
MHKHIRFIPLFIPLVFWRCGTVPLTFVPPSYQQAPPSLPTLSSATQIETEIHQLINQHRLNQGLSPLNRNNQLDNIARQHSQRQLSQNSLSHDGIESRIQSAQCQYFGENVAMNNYGNIATVAVSGWLHSLGHRKNIFTPNFTNTGIGVKIDNQGTAWITQNFDGC